MGGFIIKENTIYSCVSERKGLRTIDANSGQIIDSLKCGVGAIIFADGLLYYHNQKGEVNLIKPNPTKPELISSFKMTAGTKEHFAHPVIKDGILYLRHGKVLQAFDIKRH
jgi:hypothetical protein